MTALISMIAALIFLLASCGQPSATTSTLQSGGGGGRLICGATAAQPGASRLSGCTDSTTLVAANGTGKVTVTRRGAALDISLQNALNGASWSGTAMLRFPTGGTGTRARVFVDQPAFASFGCEFDTLLRCTGQ